MNIPKKESSIRENYFEKIYIAFFVSVVILLFLYRIIHGADLTDESFYCTLAYRLVKGNHLFTDMWEQCSTAAVLPAFLLKLFLLINGGTDGLILFFRAMFFICNLGATVILFQAQRKYLDIKYVILISLFYLIYAPFHFYIFSYNNLSDMLFMIVVNTILLALERTNSKLFFLSGCLCSFIAFTYPPMIILCPIMVILLFVPHKKYKGGWLYFAFGGILFAFLILEILCITIGINGIIIGIKGILSDPAYSIETMPLKIKVMNAFEYLFTPISNDGIYIKIYFISLFIVAFFKKKFPILKICLALLPIIIYIELMPIRELVAYGTGSYIFYIAFLCPFLIFFTENKNIFTFFLYFEWIPAMCFYAVLAIFSYGGGAQARQGLIVASLVTLKEIALIILETFQEYELLSIGYKKIKCWLIILFLSFSILCELKVHYTTVYRDGSIAALSSRVEKGPYKGIYTTKERKNYLEEMTDLMLTFQEKDKTVCILHHSNFAYLMLDMIPATPTTWGLYPHIDNQNVFFKYFSLSDTHIPDIIFIVNVPEEHNSDAQSEEYYLSRTRIELFLNENYTLVDEKTLNETGSVRKYVLVSDKETFIQSIDRISVYTEYADNFYGIETDGMNSWSWCSESGAIVFHNDTFKTQTVHISMNAYTDSSDISNLTVQYNDSSLAYEVNNKGSLIELDTELYPGNNIFSFFSDAPRAHIDGDSRDLRFLIYNVSITLE